MPDRRDLPQLERIEVRYHPSHLDSRVYSNRFYGWTVVILTVAEHLLRMYRELVEVGQHSFHRPDQLNRLGAYLAGALLLLYLIETILLRVHSWKTDERGITARKLLWNTAIRWADIREVRVRKPAYARSPLGYRLVTGSGSLWVPLPAVMHRQYALLLGSIYQHLRRMGKGDEVEVPGSLDDMWWKIPSSVPEQASWTNPSPEAWRPLRALLFAKLAVGVVFAGLGVGLLGLRTVQSAILMAVMFVGGVWGLLWYFLCKQRTVATTASVSADGIEAETGYGHVLLRWTDIRAADWSDAEGMLRISGRGGTVRIPNQGGTSGLLLLAIRWLRSLKEFECIQIPEDLLYRYRVPA